MIFHIAKAVKNRTSLVLIQGIDLASKLKQQPADLWRAIKVSRMKNKMMQRNSLIIVCKIKIEA